MNQLKNKKILIKISEDDKSELVRRACQQGMNLSSYIRSVSLDRKIVVKTDKEMIRQIRYIGNNINQMAHVLNTFADGLIIADAYKQLANKEQTEIE